jgi:hypothetical protein
MKLISLLGLIIVLAVPSVALAQEVYNCDGQAVALDGTLSMRTIIHEGTGEAINCVVLRSSLRPYKCDFLGDATLFAEVQVVVNETTTIYPEGATITDGSTVTISGTLVPGETAWYCREVGIIAKSVTLTTVAASTQKQQTAESATVKGAATEPVMWDCQCACRCPSKKKPYDFEQPGHLCESPDKDPRLVAEETEAVCREIIKSECRNPKCHCEGCKAYDAPCGE